MNVLELFSLFLVKILEIESNIRKEHYNKILEKYTLVKLFKLFYIYCLHIANKYESVEYNIFHEIDLEAKGKCFIPSKIYYKRNSIDAFKYFYFDGDYFSILPYNIVSIKQDILEKNKECKYFDLFEVEGSFLEKLLHSKNLLYILINLQESSPLYKSMYYYNTSYIKAIHDLEIIDNTFKSLKKVNLNL